MFELQKYIPDKDYVFDIETFDFNARYDYTPPREDIVKLVYYDKYEYPQGNKINWLKSEEEYHLECWKDSLTNRKYRFQFRLEGHELQFWFYYIYPYEYIECLNAIEKDLLDDDGCIYIDRNVIYDKEIIKMVFDYLRVASGDYRYFLYNLIGGDWIIEYAKGKVEKTDYYYRLRSGRPLRLRAKGESEKVGEDNLNKFFEIQKYFYKKFDEAVYEFQLGDIQLTHRYISEEDIKERELAQVQLPHPGQIWTSPFFFNSKYGKDRIDEVRSLCHERARTYFKEDHLRTYLDKIGKVVDYEFVNEVLGEERLLKPTPEEEKIDHDFREKYGFNKCSNVEEEDKLMKELSTNPQFVEDAKKLDSYNRKTWKLMGYQSAVSQYFKEKHGVGKIDINPWDRDKEVEIPKEMLLDNWDKYYFQMKEELKEKR